MSVSEHSDPLAFLWEEYEQAASMDPVSAARCPDAEVESIDSATGLPYPRGEGPPLLAVSMSEPEITPEGVLRPISPHPAFSLSEQQGVLYPPVMAPLEAWNVGVPVCMGVSVPIPAAVLPLSLPALRPPQEGPSTSQRMQDIASQRQRLVAESLQNLASGMETMADAQEQLGSVATSSHRRSQQALEMV